MNQTIDPAGQPDQAADPALVAMPLDELRALRGDLQHEDDAISYVRRLAQARIDLVRAVQRHRAAGESGPPTGELPIILKEHLTATGGSPRPPRPADDFSDHILATELEALCDDYGGADVSSLADDKLAEFSSALQQFEQARSHERKELFGRIDALSAELVRRYRDGEADVDGLLADD